jgi:hypothetical protein
MGVARLLRKTRKQVAVSLLSAMTISTFAFANVLGVSAAMTALSITGTGITANSAATGASITPTINFTPANAIGSSDELTIALNGTVADDQILSADVTVGGGCSGTVSLVTVADTTVDPVLEITGVTCTAATPATVVVASGQLVTSSTAGNYAISVRSPADVGAFFFYIGDENDVEITATVDDTLSFVIRNTADNGDQPNVGGANTPNLCDLGNLSTASVQTCSYRLKVSTNAPSGYDITIATDGSLRNAGDTEFINNVTEDTTVTGGTEGYGIAFAGGATTSGTCTEQGNFNDDDTPTATAVTTGINTALLDCAGPNNPAGTDTTNTALVTHRAESDAGTAADSYSQLVTYTVAPSF